MRLRGAAGIVGLLLAASIPAAGQEPFPFEEIDFTPDCAPNVAFNRLLSVFVPSHDDSGSVSGTPIYELVSGDVSQVLWLDRAAAWHGLGLVGVRFDHGIERGPANFTLVFAEEPERVRTVWNARGWSLPPVGQTRDVEDLEGYASIGVEADGEGATVTCYRD